MSALIQSRYFSWHVTRYMLKDVLFSFLVGTSIFLLIMLMFQVIRLSEFVVLHQVSVRDVGALCFDMMLSFVPIAVPVAFLFSVLMSISRANSEGEIVAFQVSGFSLKQLFSPVAALSLLVTAFCLWASLYFVPRGNRAFELLIERIGNEHVMSQLKPGIFQEGFFGLTLFAEHIVPLKNEMKRIFIYDEREENLPLIVTAQAGILRSSPERGSLTLRLSNGSIHVDRRRGDGIQQKIDFEVYDINLNIADRADGGREYSMPSYTYPQLKQRLKETVNDPQENRSLFVEIHRRISLSFSCIVFAALGFTIGTGNQRGVRSTAIVFCIFVALIYWIAYLATNALSSAGWVAPWLGIWVPNFLFLGLSYHFYRRQTLR